MDTENKMQPLRVTFNKTQTHIFVCYPTGIEVLGVKYDPESGLPTLSRLGLMGPKEFLEVTYYSRTPILRSEYNDTYAYYLFKSEEGEGDRCGTHFTSSILIEIPTLKQTSEGQRVTTYYVEQVKIVEKDIISRHIVRNHLRRR